MRSGVQRGRLVAALVVIAALLAAGCGDDEPSAGEDPTERLVGIYSATVTAVVAQSDVPSDDGEDDDGGDEGKDEDTTRTVFLQAHEDNEISAEVQVGVVNELDDWANVRFIDDLEEAVDESVDGAPVRDHGVLIGLGPATEGAVTSTLVADQYVSATQTMVFDVSLRRRSGEWTVEEPLEGVSVRNP